jgi:ligand-binding sensor domain-containing protein
VGSWTIALDRFTDDTSPPAFQHLAQPTGTIDTTARRTWTYSGAEDAAGRVWLGMDTADDVAYPPLGVTIYQPDGTWLGAWSKENSKMAGEFVWALERDKFARMWLGYKALGVDYVPPNAAGPDPVDPNKFVHLTPEGNTTVRGIAAHGDSMWVLSETFLRRYHVGSATGAPTLDQTIEFPTPGLSSLPVHPLAAAPDGSVWAATADGLWHVVPRDTVHDTMENSPLVSDAVRSVTVEPGGAVWIGTVAGLQRFDPAYVAPPPPPQVSFHIRPYPNPATSTNLGIRLRLVGAPAGTSGYVYDIGGRRVRAFRIATESAVFWDGRDDDGRLVKPGVYFVRAAAGGQEAFARVVILH